MFAIAFSVVRKFLNEYTLGKIQIFKNDPKKWKKALLENIDENNLPKYYGGELVDPDGNPKYTSKVWHFKTEFNLVILVLSCCSSVTDQTRRESTDFVLYKKFN